MSLLKNERVPSNSCVNLEGSFVILRMREHIEITRLKLVCREIRDLWNHLCDVLEFQPWRLGSCLGIVAIVAAAARSLGLGFPAYLDREESQLSSLVDAVHHYSN